MGRKRRAGARTGTAESKAPSQQASGSAQATGEAGQIEVIGFYSNKPGRRFREFSNFFDEAPPFMFQLPAFARLEGCPEEVPCEFSEKAIMITKAALMGDSEIFAEIATSSNPADCKKLGRGVRNFNQELWDKHIEEVAFEVVKQKFAADATLRKVLLSTGDKVIAEAAPNDCIWGIGLPTGDARVGDPAQWCGRNILGYALMKTRTHLRSSVA
eukprot:gnl/TRDRNA2_/TRDRNA2_180201_c0_seq1.p1 gnl/TRDRNA2_/TRDRNA2_180201_c0~~gnl/TRDRNA2_/TRDRNA2_180201_c0_seq1.p1  ORF type:complete len:239 (+),score=45.65 gnl/TRDRNA2_/TRDRNA2_180201_c0_seq1:77-718(+)